MSERVVHVVPGDSAAASVGQALKLIGARERVVAVGDPLCYGPIVGDADARRAWLEDNLGDGYGDCVDAGERAWRDALAEGAYPVIWTCRADASEYAGFLEFLSRVGARPFGLIDATDLIVEGRNTRWPVAALSLVPAEQMLVLNLFQRRRHMTAHEMARARVLWSRLKAENAPLRVVEIGALMSQPLSFFDAALLDEVAGLRDWERATRIVGGAMARFGCEAPHRRVSDSFIWKRYLALVDQGAVEMEGDGGMWDCRLRVRRTPT